MELHRSSPPTLVSHNPAGLNLPSVPQTELSHPHVQGDITLPDLKTILSPAFQHAPPPAADFRSSHHSATSGRSLPPIDPGNGFLDETRGSAESAVVSPSEAGSAMSMEDRGLRSTSVVSMDDPDVRIAAEALSGLANIDFVRSPPNGTFSHASPTSSSRAAEQAEPLFRLFTKAHPWVGGTINGSLNAYSTTKHYSPRLVQYGANLVERNITTPVVSTVSTVGRMTGVESGLRWYYGGSTSEPGEIERSEEDPGSRKRRLVDDEMDLESGLVSPRTFRRDSQESRAESLPAYRSSKPPSYREEASPMAIDRQLQIDRPAHNQSWSSQVFVMTSGLGIALSDTSRRSLRFCLNLLSNAAQHVATVMDALRLVLEQYDEAREVWHQNHDSSVEKGERPRTPEHDEAARRLAQVIKKHSDDIWQTLQTVVNSVSNLAGGALPDNARQFVRTQLMSLPQRWRFASDSQTGDSETSRSAHRMIAFATEGLDMMSQVSLTMKLTLDSAEGWLERVGRRREFDSPRDHKEDHHMEDVSEKR